MSIQIPEGFTAHQSTECPCPCQAADVMFEDGHISRACVQMPKADGWFWGHSTTPTANIVAYRVIENPDF